MEVRRSSWHRCPALPASLRAVPLALALALPLHPAPGHAAAPSTPAAYRPIPTAAPLRPGMTDRYSSIVVDAASGQVLSEIAADAPRYPASLTKLMTLYMLFEALRDHRVSLDQQVPITAHAAAAEPSKLGLLPGMHLTVEQGILGLVTKSANDAASALGELLGGDEDRFAEMMTLRARALGMSHTVFRNASGLPDPDQISTARDLALLARHLIQDFPAQYAYFSVPSFVFHGQTIYNHDHMLLTYPGADGLKTGFTDAAGHNLVTSAMHGPVRLIGVVLGARSNPERDLQMAALLNTGFAQEGAPLPGPDQTARIRLAAMRGFIAHVPSLIGTAQAETLPAHARRHGRSVVQNSPAALHAAALHPARAHPAHAAHAATARIVQIGSYGSAAAALRAAHAAPGTIRVVAAAANGHRLWRVQRVTDAQADPPPARLASR